MIVRSVPLIASALLHTTAVVAFYGGGSRIAPPTDDIVPIDLTVEAPVSFAHPPAVAPEAMADVPMRHSHRHVHPYPVPADHDARPHPADQQHVTVAAGPIRAERDAPSPVVAEATTSAPELPRFVIGSGSSVRSTGPRHDGAGEADLPIPEAFVSVPAKLLASAPATYPANARMADEEADVPLEIVVDGAGRVIDARVSKTIGSGFDESALQAVRSYRFQPAVRDGRPVAVRMKWVVQFRLH